MEAELDFPQGEGSLLKSLTVAYDLQSCDKRTVKTMGTAP